MSRIALFVHHRALPGQRARVQGIWEEHVQPRVRANPDHEAYYFCHDAEDEDVVCVFQLFRRAEAIEEFLAGDWYPRYLEEVATVVEEAPRLTRAIPQWIKGEESAPA